MFQERLMDIVRKSIKDGYYSEELERLVDEVAKAINTVIDWDAITGGVP